MRSPRPALALLCAGLIAACSFGGEPDERAANPSTTERRTRDTTEVTVLGTVTEREIAPASPAEAVAVPTTAPPPTTTARPTPRPTTTTVATTTTTTLAPSRPNQVSGRYDARPGTTTATVDLYKDGVLAASRELSGSGTFDFMGLPDDSYRVLVTDRQVDADASSEVITACDILGLTDGDRAVADIAWDRECTVALDAAARLRDL